MIFTLPVTTRVEDFDQKGLLTPPALLSLFENTSARHADQVGYSVMKESLCCGLAWVVTNWRIEILRAPSYEEAFSVSTWLRNGPRQATREMLLKSEAGEILARGQAKLCMVDRRTGTPMLSSPERMAAYDPEPAPPPSGWQLMTPSRLRPSPTSCPGCGPRCPTPTPRRCCSAAATWTTTAICTIRPI